jgi:predicted aspartyl protease
VLSLIDCQNLGLIRKDREKIRLITVKGETTARVFTAPSMEIMGTNLKAENVDVVAKKVMGFPLIIGMTFLENFNWSYNKAKNEFTIEK